MKTPRKGAGRSGSRGGVARLGGGLGLATVEAGGKAGLVAAGFLLVDRTGGGDLVQDLVDALELLLGVLDGAVKDGFAVFLDRVAIPVTTPAVECAGGSVLSDAFLGAERMSHVGSRSLRVVSCEPHSMPCSAWDFKPGGPAILTGAVWYVGLGAYFARGRGPDGGTPRRGRPEVDR